jgi:hypothetical protein
MKFYFSAVLILLFSTAGSAQVELKGTLTGKSAGQKINGATILLKKDKVGVAQSVSNENGEFELKNIQIGEYSLEISSIGFKSYSQHLSLKQNTELNISLTENAQVLSDVHVFTSLMLKKNRHPGFRKMQIMLPMSFQHR